MTHNPDADQCSDPKLDSLIASIQSGDRKERACDSLVMCILTTLNQGLRNGGGIGDILRAPSSTVSHFSEFVCNFKIQKKKFFLGSAFRCTCYIRSTVLLHCDHYSLESYFRCYYRYICRFEKRKTTERINTEEYLLYMRT